MQENSGVDVDRTRSPNIRVARLEYKGSHLHPKQASEIALWARHPCRSPADLPPAASRGGGSYRGNKQVYVLYGLCVYLTNCSLRQGC